MNAKEAREAVEKYGSQRAAERALGIGGGTICRLLNGKRRAKAQADGNDASSVCLADGIALSPATRILDRRPPSSARSKFWSLPKGRAFPVSELARKWGFSVETVKRHARDENCFAYIDTTGHDDFEECAMHPDTAATRLKGNK